MVGNSITSAPSACSRAVSASACSLARVTTIRLPKSGRRSYQLSLLAQPDHLADDDRGGRLEAAAAISAGSVDSVPVSVS